MRALLTPNEVAVLADTPKSVVEKAVEQEVVASPRNARSRRRSLALHAAAGAAAAKCWAGASQSARSAVGSPAARRSKISWPTIPTSHAKHLRLRISSAGRIRRSAVRCRAERARRREVFHRRVHLSLAYSASQRVGLARRHSSARPRSVARTRSCRLRSHTMASAQWAFTMYSTLSAMSSR
jgi:hypothetical protein